MVLFPFADSDPESDPESDQDVTDDYNELLTKLVEKWLVMEVKHRTSKCASEDFWDLAKDFFPKIARARIQEMVYKPIPKLRSQRNKTNDDNVPDINLEIGFSKKDNEEVTIVNEDTTPLKRFHPEQYNKLFEVATVQVIIYDHIHTAPKGSI